MIAVDAGSLDKVKALLAVGANPKAKDSRGGTSLTRAQVKNFKAILEDLNAAVKAQEEGKGGKSVAAAAEEEEGTKKVLSKPKSVRSLKADIAADEERAAKSRAELGINSAKHGNSSLATNKARAK